MARRSFVLAVMGTVVFFLCSFSSADVPDSINYQGKLTTAAGGCLNDTVQMTFSIYPDTLPGTLADWSETQTQVTVKEGVFSVLLGSVNSLPASVFDGSTKYLGVQVETDPEMRPLKPMVSVAYAFRSEFSDTAEYARAAPAMPDDDWVIDGDNIYHEQGKVGIGTSSPGRKLHISGNSESPPTILLQTTEAPTDSQTLALYASVPTGDFGIGRMTDDGGSLHRTDLRIEASTGNIGIGTSSPAEKLDVDGTVRMTGFKMPTDPSDGYVLTSDASGVGTWQEAGGSNWSLTNSVLYTNDYWGLARGGADNALYGDNSHTMVNFGVACTTGISGENYYYLTVSGGYGNVANDLGSTVGGGRSNKANGSWSTISGGYGNTASGDLAAAGGGYNNTASGYASTVGGGRASIASGQYGTVAGGYSNAASGANNSTVSGGSYNTASGNVSTIGGGDRNLVEGGYSVIPGGYADTITATADYSYLFGIKSKLTEDSTFMVDMPHIRFGDETNGYEFPTSDGANNQVMATDGSGQLSWVDGGGGNWSVIDSVLYTNNWWGIARGGAWNVLYGDSAHTMVNLGVACTTGTSGQNYYYSTISGGLGNKAPYLYSTVGGGYDNKANDSYATVAGGESNTASGYISTIAGGLTNTASGGRSTIGGGDSNIASGYISTIAGGLTNTASGGYSTVGGGSGNTGSGSVSTVGGGAGNTASFFGTTVGGGSGNTASSYYSTVSGGWSNIANQDYSTVGGGWSNTASGGYSTVGGGSGNTGNGSVSTVGGGYENTTSGNYSTVGGGQLNSNAGSHSVIPGGYADTITATADYSYLFGIKSKLTEDSTFMVDMPHIRFGDETNSYEFPASDGANNQVMATDGSGQLSWVDGGGGNWSVTDSVLYTNNWWGIARGGAGNAFYGDSAHTMVNFGVACTTGTNGENHYYSTVSGGYGNAASGIYSTVGGGRENPASGSYSTVGGGAGNTASFWGTTVGGGNNNTASGWAGTVGGGQSNTASDFISTVSGGQSNTASGGYSTVGGGWTNTASGSYSTIGGGNNDTSKALYGGVFSGYSNLAGDAEDDTGAFVGGGWDNSATAKYATVSGGWDNTASGHYSTVGGGNSDTSKALYGGVFSGYSNLAGDEAADTASFVGGGWENVATAKYATVGGGRDNTGSGDYSTVGGGMQNTPSGGGSTVGGGNWNTASGGYSTVGGGQSNTASSYYNTVGGGSMNTASGIGGYSTVAGGYSNTASGAYCATVPGGLFNTAGGDYSFAVGNRAKANHDGSIVIAANSSASASDSVRSGGNEQMVLRADGGLYITNYAQLAPYDNSNIITTRGGAYLSGSGVTWTDASDRNLKENFTSVDGLNILENLSRLPITEWNYISEGEGVRRIGPMGQDFFKIFGIGKDEKSISPRDLAGIALVAIQELEKSRQEHRTEIDQLKAQVSQLQELVQKLLAERENKQTDENTQLGMKR